ncbi:MAG: hypothetical protein MUF66_12235 [Gammaproteobacteria bacterium]|nr:hypothetical protein [Gammaproteobacteria bacterium]
MREIGVKFRVDDAQASAAFRRVQATAKTTGDRVKGAFTGIASSIRGAFSGLPGLLAGVTAGLSVANLVAVNREFARLGAALETVTGSASAGQAAFARLEAFAARTPFSVEELTQAFIRLTGKTLEQFVEAVADATTGEFERLKEFGIRAEQQGNKVALTFQGVTTVVSKSAAEIERYLRRIGEVEFGGAMERRAATLDGALSNLGDSFSRLAREIGESGINDAIASVSATLGGAVDASRRTDIQGLAGQLAELRAEEERLARVASAPRTETGIRGAGQAAQRGKAAQDLAKVRFDIAEVEQRLLDLQPAAKTAGDAIASALGKGGTSAREAATALAKLQEGLKGTREKIGAGPEKPAGELTTLDFAGAITKARSSFAAGDTEAALKSAEKARGIVEQMTEAGRESDLVLGGLTAQVEQLGVKIGEKLAGKGVEIPIATTYEQALAELPAVRERLQSAAAANPIKVPVYAELVLPDGSTYSAGGQTSGDVSRTLADEALKRGAKK